MLELEESKVVFSLDELDNTNNLKNGSPSYNLFTHHVTAYEDSTPYEDPIALSIRNLRKVSSFP